jgi:hypothetical protein
MASSLNRWRCRTTGSHLDNEVVFAGFQPPILLRPTRRFAVLVILDALSRVAIRAQQLEPRAVGREHVLVMLIECCESAYVGRPAAIDVIALKSAWVIEAAPLTPPPSMARISPALPSNL